MRDTAAIAAATATAAAIAAPAAGAAGWGFEQLTPHDGATSEPIAIGVSEDQQSLLVGTLGDPLPGFPADGRSGLYYYGVPRSGSPWMVGPADATNGPQVIANIKNFADDGSSVLMTSTEDLLHEGFGPSLFHFASNGVAWNVGGAHGIVAAAIAATPDLQRVAIRPGSVASLYLFSPGAGLELISVDNDGNPMNAQNVGGTTATGEEVFRTGAMAPDGSSVIFGSTTALDGDNDNSADLYRRVLTPGAEETILISDATPGNDPDPSGDARFRWASPDHRTVIFHTQAALADGDADNATDLYLRRDDGPLIRITKGETVDGNPTGNATGANANADWVATAAGGDLVYFLSRERLTQDAPTGTTWKLYERDLDEEVTRFVAGPLATADGATSTVRGFIGNRDLDAGFRPLRAVPGGVIFQTTASLVADDGDSLMDVYRWTRDGGVELLSAPEPGAPASAPARAEIMAVNPSRFNEFAAVRPGRVITADGSTVFFTTAESLTADDTDGGYADVYAWSEDGGLELVTAFGDDPYDATYLDSSPDGTRVWFQTGATVLASDLDANTIDTYLAIRGGGQAPSKPTPPQGLSGPPMGGGPSTGGGPGADQPALPASAGPLPDDAAPPVTDAPGDGGDGARAELSVRAGRVVRDGSATLRIASSTSGELRVRALARLRKGKETRIGSVTETVRAGARRVRVELRGKAQRRLARDGRLRVRFVVRLVPSDGAPVTERATVTLRSGERR